MRNLAVLSLLVPVLCGPLLGCGARSIGSDLDEDGGADGAAGDAAGGDTAAGSDGSIPPSVDAIGPTDDAISPPPSDGGVADASPPADASVRCGTKVCDGLTQDCCLTGGAGGASATCITKGGSCGGGVALGCTSSAGCPSGQVCCLTISGGSGGKAVCATTCGTGAPPGPGGGSVTLCATDAECPKGTTCRGVGPGIRGCLPSGPPGPGGGGGTPPPPDGG